LGKGGGSVQHERKTLKARKTNRHTPPDGHSQIDQQPHTQHLPTHIQSQTVTTQSKDVLSRVGPVPTQEHALDARLAAHGDAEEGQ
jgi:hypothetical protein